MYNLISEDYLIHHGVKGMKWGVRHDPERKGRFRSGVSAGLTAAKMHYTQGYNPGKTSYRYTQKSNKGLSNRQKKILKGAAIATGLVGAAAVGTIAVRNIKTTKVAKKAVMSALEKKGYQDVNKAINAHKERWLGEGERAKFLHDKNLREATENVSYYHKIQYDKITANKDSIVESYKKSVPKKEINKEAKSLAKEWRDISKQNNKIYIHNKKVRRASIKGKPYKGKPTYEQYKQYKQRSDYKVPANWWKYYPGGWM